MDQSTINLFHERGSEITAMLGEVSKFKAEMRQKTSELADLIDIKNKPMAIKQWYFRKEQMLFDDLIHDISLTDDFVCSIDCLVSAEG